MTFGRQRLERSGLQSPAVLLCGAAVVVACEHPRYPTADGTLIDVASPTIVLTADAVHPTLTVSNVDARGRCLRLTGLRATVNGEDQSRAFAGGVVPEGWCAPASFTLGRFPDSSRSADAIEVRDETHTLSAQFPNVLTPSNWRIRPPDTAAPGEAFIVALTPKPSAGVASTDPGAFLLVMVDGEPVPRAILPTGDILVSLPRGASTHETEVWISSEQSSVPSLECSAARCRATSQVHVRAPIRIAR